MPSASLLGPGYVCADSRPRLRVAALDQILDGSGTFDHESIAFFNSWHGWMNSVLSAWQRNREIPPVPTRWSQGTTAAVAGPIQAAVAQTATAEPAIRLNLANDAEL